jgi:aldehyde dehydrogenase (NAD+)/phenylacetaldehyde dehydrogenase
MHLPHDDYSDTMVSKVAQTRVRGYFKAGQIVGSRLVTDGKAPIHLSERGSLVEPTIFTDVQQTMSITREEIFRPAMCVLKWANEIEIEKYTKPIAQYLGTEVLYALPASDVMHQSL